MVAGQFEGANPGLTKVQHYRKSLGLVALEVLHVDVTRGVEDEGAGDWNVEDRVEEDRHVLRLLSMTDQKLDAGHSSLRERFEVRAEGISLDVGLLSVEGRCTDEDESVASLIRRQTESAYLQKYSGK